MQTDSKTRKFQLIFWLSRQGTPLKLSGTSEILVTVLVCCKQWIPDSHWVYFSNKSMCDKNREIYLAIKRIPISLRWSIDWCYFCWKTRWMPLEMLSVGEIENQKEHHICGRIQVVQTPPRIWKISLCVVVPLTLQVHMCVHKTGWPWKLIQILAAVPDVVSLLEQINLSLGVLYAGIYLTNFFLFILSYNDY